MGESGLQHPVELTLFYLHPSYFCLTLIFRRLIEGLRERRLFMDFKQPLNLVIFFFKFDNFFRGRIN